MSKRQATQYTEEFRKSSAKLAVDSPQAISVTAEELGVHVTTLHGWVKKYHPHSHQARSPSPDDTILDELKRLRKENNKLRQERDILKKAAAYFANEVV